MCGNADPSIDNGDHYLRRSADGKPALENGAVRVTRIMLFDGEHWEEAMAKLAEVREA